MSTPIRILVIDDSPLIRGLLKEGLSTIGEVLMADSASQAIAQIDFQAPDLILADTEMPSLSGQPLIREIRQRVSAPVVALTARDAVGAPSTTLEDTADEAIEKPFFIRDVQTRIRRIVDGIKLQRLTHSDRENCVRGTLAQMSILDLLQSLEMGRKTCCLSLKAIPGSVKSTKSNGERNQQPCEMYFVEGRLVHAVYGWLLGDEAVYGALRWEGDGNFEIDFSATADMLTTTQTTQALLLEGLRQLDEENHDPMDEASAEEKHEDVDSGEKPNA